MKEKWGPVYDLLKDIAIGIVIWFFVIMFIGEARVVPSGSMEPTILIGDRLWTDKIGLRFRDIQQGDIVVFDPPFESDSPYIKRVIGLPGDRVAIADGKVFVNDQALTEPYLKAAPTYTWGPEVVPEGKYFVLGDNRNNSNDSHHWGFLDADKVKSRAIFRFWPFSRIGKLQ